MSNTIPLYLVTGFLGSGKTSIINSLLSQVKEKRVGLILNDFGSIVVDSALIKSSSEVVAIKNLSGGQIFCSCLSGSFVKSVIEMADQNPDFIIVEASGLAKPAPLLEIVSIITDKTKQRVTYGGMMCVVDAERYLTLSQSLMTLEEQVMFSDWFIINKSDLVNEEVLASTVAKITSLRPLAPVYTSSYGLFSDAMMKQLNEEISPTLISFKDAHLYAGWGTHGRPKNCVFIPEGPYEIRHIEELLTSIAHAMLRMKGFLSLHEGNKALLVDVVGPHVKVIVTENPIDTEIGVVCIYSAKVDAISLITQKWSLISNSTIRCIELT